MAGRIRIYKIIRKIHLVSSMLILSFLLMYVITGLFMMNRNLFEIPPHEIAATPVMMTMVAGETTHEAGS